MKQDRVGEVLVGLGLKGVVLLSSTQNRVPPPICFVSDLFLTKVSVSELVPQKGPSF